MKKRFEITRKELYRIRKAVPGDKPFIARRRAFIQTKVCPVCKDTFTKKEETHQYNWRFQKFCGKSCAAVSTGKMPRAKRGHYKKFGDRTESARYIHKDCLDRSLDEAFLKARTP